MGGGGATLLLDPLDVTALEPAAQAACADALVRLLAALEIPLQFLVRRRRAAPPEPDAPAAASPVARLLDRAVADHHAARLRASPAFSVEARVVLHRRTADGAAAERQLAMVGELLRAAGLRARPLDAPSTPVPDAATPVVEHATSVATATGSVCSLELERLPGRPVALGWLHGLLAAPAEFDASILLTPVDAAGAHRAVERRLRALTADRMLELERGRIGDPSLDVGLEAAEALRERLARNEVRPIRLAITVAAHGADAVAAHHAADVVRAAASGAGLRLRHAHLRQAAVFAGVAGGDGNGGKLVDSVAAATCLPLTETACADPGGYRVGEGRRTGLPVSVDVFDSTQHSNANLAVFASSGHGKSYTIGALILEAVAHGVGALVIDPEGEYERVMHAVGGQYLRLGVDGGALNVFDAAPGEADSVAVALDLVTVLCGNALSEVERARVDAVLHNAVRTASAHGRRPLLGDCIGPLEAAAPRAATVLRRVCNGPMAAVFNRPSDIDLDGDLCAISLRELPHEFVAAATLLIAQWLWSRVRGDRRRRHVVLDEVGALCAHPALRDLLVQLARRCRKYGASLVVATQNVEDLLRTDEGAVVATNCATVLLGGHRAAEAERMERAFGLTAGQRRFVEHAGRGEFLLLAGRRRCELRVDVPELHRAILRPR